MPFFKLKPSENDQKSRELKEKYFIDKFKPELNRDFNFAHCIT